MESEAGVVSEVIQSGVEAGDDRSVVEAMKARRQSKVEARDKAVKDSKPEAKTEPKGQPEQKAEKAEPEKPTASSEAKEPKSEAQPQQEPKAAEATVEAAEAKPEEPKESPRIRVEFDGKTEEITVDEARSGYMRSRDYTHKTQELAKERETFSAEVSQKRQLIENTIGELGTLAQHMVQRLVDEDQRTDWNQLKATDPDTYAVRVAERTERRELLRTVLAKATQLQQQQRQEQNEKLQTDFLNRKKEEERKLALVIPEWSDPEKAKAEKAELAKFLQERGFSEDEVTSLIDHRAIALSREAMLYRRMLDAKRKAETEKKVEVKAPTSPASVKGDTSNTVRLEKAKERFQRSGGSVEATAKLLAERRKARK